MQAQNEITRTRQVRGGWGHFAQHYVEMVIAMAVGMLVFGAATRGLLTLAGAELSATRHPVPASLEMAFDMSVGMLVWMRVRGHGWAGSLEMCGAMFTPLAVLFPPLWLDVVGADSMITLEHAVMLPLMLVVMLRRRAEYAH